MRTNKTQIRFLECVLNLHSTDEITLHQNTYKLFLTILQTKKYYKKDKDQLNNLTKILLRNPKVKWEWEYWK